MLSPMIVEYNPYTLTIHQTRKHVKITMELFIPIVNTNTLPKTHKILKKMLPSVLITECFNEQNIPFIEEVKHTEIGHLFEHILLENLCMLKIADGKSSATFRGRTHWNWKKDKKGIFHIIVSAGKKDAHLLPDALDQTIQLTNHILESDQIPSSLPLDKNQFFATA